VAWLLIPALIAARSWRVLAGFAAGAAINLGTGLVVIGPTQMSQFVPFILARSLPQAGVKVGLPELAVLASGANRAGVIAALILAAVALAACWRWRERLRSRPETAIGLGVAASIAFAPYVGIVDLGLLALAAVAWAQRSTAEPIAALLLIDAAWAVDFLAGSGRVHTLPLALLLFLAGATWRLLRSPGLPELASPRPAAAG
jgi:hypothetical protein